MPMTVWECWQYADMAHWMDHRWAHLNRAHVHLLVFIYLVDRVLRDEASPHAHDDSRCHVPSLQF